MTAPESTLGLSTAPGAPSERWRVTAALVLAVLAVAGSLAAILPSWHAAALVAAMAWFCLPGVLVWRVVYRGQPGAAMAAAVLGAATGYVASSLVLLGLWTLGVRSVAVLALAPALASLAAWPARRLTGRLTLPALSRRDLAALCLVLLLVPLVVARPYSRVGEQMPDGRAYRAYFTADFVWAMAVVSEVSKGDVPPHNVFYRGDDLRYYWLAHLLPAVEHRAAGAAVPIEKILLVNDFLVALAFAAFLFLFVRHFVQRPVAAAAGCVAGVLFTSFEGTAYLWRLWHHTTRTAVQNVNIDAISRWLYKSMPVDGLHRVLLYQPQHELGYILGFAALLVLLQARRIGVALLFVAGCLLGMALLFSSFAALMLTTIVALYAGGRLLRHRQWRVMAAGAVTAALPMAGALGLTQVLRYVDTAGPLVALGPNRTATTAALMAIFLSFGPMLIAAGVGLLIALRKQTLGRASVLLLVIAVSWVFYFFVDVPEHQHVYVGWRASHLLFVAFAALAAYALQELWTAGRAVRAVTVVVGALLALAAAPMVAIDLYNTQDVGNRAMGPGFRWTVLLSSDEVQALEWIKAHTRPDALVQVEPAVRGRDTWSYIPTFAERRMAAGLPIGMIPLRKYEEASARITRLYRTTDPVAAHEIARTACIDYLVVAPAEQRRYPAFQPLLDANPEYFAPVFRNGSVGVYAVTSLPASCAVPEPPR